MSLKISVVDIPLVGQETTFSFGDHPGASIHLRKRWSAYYFNIVDIHKAFDETKLAVVISVKPHESYEHPDLTGYRVAFIDLVVGDVQICGYCAGSYLSGSYSGNGLAFAVLSRPAAKWTSVAFHTYRRSELGFWEFPHERTYNIDAELRKIERSTSYPVERSQLSFDGTKVLLLDPMHFAASGRIVVFNRVGYDYLLLQTLEPPANGKTDTWCKQFGHSHEYKIKDNGNRELLVVKNEEDELFNYELSASGFFKPL